MQTLAQKKRCRAILISNEVPCRTRNKTFYNYQSNNTPRIIKSMYTSDNNIEIHEPKNDRKFQYSSLNNWY